jgi:glutathionylspermidine amidase/synthetase
MSFIELAQQNLHVAAAAGAVLIGGAFLLRSRFKSGKTGMAALPFGSLLGIAPGGVPAYSSKGISFRSHYNGEIYYGARYQCVEFARRWLVHTQGVTFGSVGMAYEIFPLPHATRVSDNSAVPWNNVPNGSQTRPVPGCILIWNEGAEFKWTGHVAVVTAVSDSYVRVAEQNVHDMSWEGRDYSRQLPAVVDAATGAFHIHEHYGKGGTITGWKLLPADFKPTPIPLPAAAAEDQVQEGCSVQ